MKDNIDNNENDNKHDNKGKIDSIINNSVLFLTKIIQLHSFMHGLQ